MKKCCKSKDKNKCKKTSFKEVRLHNQILVYQIL